MAAKSLSYQHGWREPIYLSPIYERDILQSAVVVNCQGKYRLLRSLYWSQVFHFFAFISVVSFARVFVRTFVTVVCIYHTIIIFIRVSRTIVIFARISLTIVIFARVYLAIFVFIIFVSDFLLLHTCTYI